VIVIRQLNGEEREDIRRRRDAMVRERLAAMPQVKSFLMTHEQWVQEVEEAISVYEFGRLVKSDSAAPAHA